MSVLRSLGTLLLLVHAGVVSAAPIVINEPSADRWMYPFNFSAGSRSSMSVFGAIGETDFDDRDAQALVRFDTSSLITPGLGTQNYQIDSLRLTLTVNLAGATYDPTYDALATYLNPGTDSDAGRPIELFGVGYRNGYSTNGVKPFLENSPFKDSTGNNQKSVRNAYAASFDPQTSQLIDVSNNVQQQFEAVPWAVGRITGLSAGASVPADVDMVFDLSLNDPLVLEYFQASLDRGYIEFMVTSLSSTSQQAGSGFASFYTKENLLHDPAFDDFLAGRLTGNVDAIPEPSVVILAVLGMFILMIWRRKNAAA